VRHFVSRKRAYQLFYILLAITGVVIAWHPTPWVIALISLTGVLSTDANDNGPATTLEQSIIADEHQMHKFAKMFGRYNGFSALFGSLGALSEGWLNHLHGFANSYNGFYVLVPVGLIGWFAASALNLKPLEESEVQSPRIKVMNVKGEIKRLALLFALDSSAGGLTTSAWLSYYLTHRYHISATSLGYVFFVTSMLAAISMFVAPLVAARIGLVWTMVSTHVLSNIFLIIAAFNGHLAIAVMFLFFRASLSQMDIPTRQALLMAVVAKEDRMAAAAITNAARYSVRPLAPTVTAGLEHIALGAPLVVAGSIKVMYDVLILQWARNRKYLSRDL